MHNRNRNRRFSTKKKNPNFIYNGDDCFFKHTVEAHPSEDDWNFNPSISRVIEPTDQLHYVKRIRRGRRGPWLHCFESYGLKYIYTGSIKDFVK